MEEQYKYCIEIDYTYTYKKTKQATYTEVDAIFDTKEEAYKYLEENYKKYIQAEIDRGYPKFKEASLILYEKSEKIKNLIIELEGKKNTFIFNKKIPIKLLYKVTKHNFKKSEIIEDWDFMHNKKINKTQNGN